MAVKYCFTLPDGRTVCIPIVEHFPWRRIKFPPDPPPDWLKNIGINERVRRDIGGLAAIHEIAEGLSPSLRKEIQVLTTKFIEAQKLPQHDSINFEK
ncbi:MAG: hypothetical protein ABI977_03930 [Acidobacteriota bacterium]